MRSAKIEVIDVAAYRIPTDGPEADGTLHWDDTTMVLARANAGGEQGLGYTYSHESAGELIRSKLSEIVTGRDAMAVTDCFEAMAAAVRNLGRAGLAFQAISAVDVALWDLKARLLGVPLVTLLGQVREAIPVYGSGGFTTYSIERLQAQFGGWAGEGISRVKMKVGSDPAEDVARVRAAREAIGPEAELFVDANGAYDRKEALAKAEAFREYGVSWFEEPVSSDDLEGLRLIRDCAPAGMEITAGEYGHDFFYFRRMLERGAVDVLQPDATRCGGITGFMQAGILCQAYGLPFSAHTAPAIHVHPCCALPNARHVEYFYDHARIEEMLFEGARPPVDGSLGPDLSRPGLGLEFQDGEAARYAI
ncbi:enolase C-terminal domain-like protein [Chelativorans salis]|uniref:Mandelate racemase n=1 Tax=Chelativorans salis TaxID=2978478 RepID=A0ABT2LPN7_9HYPH|nr:enolase C-terminal domain-like protein [Chelativorans sp. EGI FJ00035]MCT7376276.1 mandelate racemase [Chelativorans sp. EGI FJ00035]